MRAVIALAAVLLARKGIPMRGMVSSLLAVVGVGIVAVAPGQSRAANLNTLVSFCALANCADGAIPTAGVIADANGNLFGTTYEGGANNLDTVFEVAKTAQGYASTPTTLVSFCALANCADGRQPFGGLVVDAKGNLFGTTSFGGANDRGTVFEIARTAHGYASTPTTLVSFCSLGRPQLCADGYEPVGGLVADTNGNLFGTTIGGGAHDGGTVFEIAKIAGGYASTAITLVSFCALANCADGSFPQGLISDANGNLFGTTLFGGVNNLGTVFEVAKTADGYASTPTTLVRFNGTDGAQPPSTSLTLDPNSNLFGTTSGGGAHNQGTVFEVAKTASGYASTPTTLVPSCINQRI